MSNDKNELEAHLNNGSFQIGVAKGRWKLVSLTWPNVLIEIGARDGRRFTLRFDCTGYPKYPPTATLWDVDKHMQLPNQLWPQGGRVSQVFNPGWKGGAALYIPCDRISIEGHPNWYSEYTWLIWNAQRGLLQYIEAVYEILQSYELDCHVA
jgi:hypothetical protein